MEVVLTKSKKPDNKYDARIDGSKTVSFGQNFILNKQSIGIYICLYFGQVPKYGIL